MDFQIQFFQLKESLLLTESLQIRHNALAAGKVAQQKCTQQTQKDAKNQDNDTQNCIAAASIGFFLHVYRSCIS